MIEFLLATALWTTTAQDPAAPPEPTRQEEPLTLEDVTVTGRSLDGLIHEFVSEVAEPNRNRGLARWKSKLCVGVANLEGEAAQYLVDRISTVAADIGLDAGAPGCTPNVLVVATDDAGRLARNLVGERRRAFRMGGAGMDRGGDALEDFVETDRPVRWWQMSVPVDSETGDIAIRLPGMCTNACIETTDMAPRVNVPFASRLGTQIVDELIRTVVIIDVDQVSGLSILQLADYVAMVSLAQIDPDADTSAYASILNVHDNPGAAGSLTDWDQAYLEGLYAAERNAANQRTNRNEVMRSIRDAHRRLREPQPEIGQGVSN